MECAKRLEGIGEYYFSAKLREIENLNKLGKEIINLGIGSPDMPPHPKVIEKLTKEAMRPDMHAYQSYKGSPVLRNAISNWYKKYYSVELNPNTEILPLIGSKEGVMHICMTFINAGDEVLIPNPGYPTYKAAALLAGGTAVPYRLTEERNWYPDLIEIEKNDLSRVRLMFVNYPNMPTGQTGNVEQFTRLVAFAKKHNLLLIHDNPYSFILNEKPLSLLSIPGAMDHALELNSLSKSHNMAGWRVGMLCGSQQNIDAVLRFKSNMDSGMFLPLQLAAAEALALEQDWFDILNREYAERRTLLFELLRLLQCRFTENQSGLFIWARIPETFGNAYELSDKILQDSDVFITPGGIFGDAGDQFVRISLCAKKEKIQEALIRIKNSL